jgi:hypothetical protein
MGWVSRLKRCEQIHTATEETTAMRHLSPTRLLPAFAAALLAAGCDDSPLLQEPEVPEPIATSAGDVPSLANPRWASGYALASSPLTPSYDLSGTSFSYNQSGGAIVITKPAGTTGRWIARFAGLSALLGGKSTVLVNAYSNGAAYCKPVQGYLANDKVEVRCFNAGTKAPADVGFNVIVFGGATDPAFAFAHQPTATDYRPHAAGSFNPSGSMRVFRDGVGQYRVVFNGLGTRRSPTLGGHVQASAVGTGKHHCKTSELGGSPNLTVRVRCYGAGGSPADAKFSVFFSTPSGHLAYAWGDRPTTPSYTPFPAYTSNPTGGTVYISRIATGSYKVEWQGIVDEIIDGGTVRANAYGQGNAQCKGVDVGEEFAVVQCFKPDGSPVDSYFMVFFGS